MYWKSEKCGLFHKYRLSRVDVNLATFYKSVRSLNYCFENLVNYAQWLINNTNLFIARNTEATEGINSEFNTSFIQSLFTIDATFSRISIGNSAKSL